MVSQLYQSFLILTPIIQTLVIVQLVLASLAGWLIVLAGIFFKEAMLKLTTADIESYAKNRTNVLSGFLACVASILAAIFWLLVCVFIQLIMISL